MAKGKVVLMMITAALMMEGSRAISLCDMDDEGIEACRPSVTQPNPVDPTPECCEALKGANLTCLCSYKNSYWLPSLGIDPALAMGLPPKCKLDMPPDC
ncbi:Detected protein of confused Function [Hibiscus syriacus]|uniref:Detected protein of confused Function n=1 Tax=Hibiscus syriacus TaxID=106335 RepID=A0A6A2ZJ97_HIBSY|nr:putative lipid-transfer protein DIR1 [Hibiscus syriacus]KAE8692124.1 Detected protein of confused Function [Hibiscus syriacus]